MSRTVVKVSLLIFTALSCSKPEVEPLVTQYYDLSIPDENKRFKDWLEHKEIYNWYSDRFCYLDTLYASGRAVGTMFYSDSLYQVFSSCSGEFGGHLFVVPLNHGKVAYYARVSCPRQLIKSTEVYTILESNPHDQGYSRIGSFNIPGELIVVGIDTLAQFLASTRSLKAEPALRPTKLDTWGVDLQCLNYGSAGAKAVFSSENQLVLGYMEQNQLFNLDTLISRTVDTSFPRSSKPVMEVGQYRYLDMSRYYPRRNGEEPIVSADTLGVFVKGDHLVLTYGYSFRNYVER